MNIDLTKLKAYGTMPTVKSTDGEWLDWVKSIDKRYGTSYARSLFYQLWTKRGSDKANTLTLRQTLKSEYNIQIDETVWNKIVDLGGGISDTFGSIFKTGKVFVYALIGVSGVVVIVMGITAIKQAIPAKSK